MTHAAAIGHNNVAGLNTLDPPPRSTGITYADIRYAADGSVSRHGSALTSWLYDYLTPEDFATVRSALGLSESTKSALVTIQTLNNEPTPTFANYNARAILPEEGDGYERSLGKYLNVVWRFVKLEATS